MSLIAPGHLGAAQTRAECVRGRAEHVGGLRHRKQERHARSLGVAVGVRLRARWRLMASAACEPGAPSLAVRIVAPGC